MKMNLVFIIIDTLRKDHCGCYGNDWIATPGLDALAKDSAVFDAAYPESLPTLPQRRAMHTGIRTYPFRNYHDHKGDFVKIYGWEPIPEEQTTVSEMLKNAGYHTGIVCDAYHCFKPSMNYARGFDQFIWIRGQEADKYRAILPEKAIRDRILPWMKGTTVVNILQQHCANAADWKSERDHFGPKVFLTATQWLEENTKNQPFFLLVDSFDPHEPWDAPEEYWRKYDPNYSGKPITMPLYGRTDFLGKEELNNMRAQYAAEVTLVDKYLGKFLKKMKDLGLMDNTLVLLISDHGHQLGEHGVMGKVPPGLHPELIDLVMMIRHPTGLGAGKRVKEPVYNIDLVATGLKMLGIGPPQPIDGRDMTPLIKGTSGWKKRHLLTCGFQDYTWVRDDRYALITRNNGTNQTLYDLRRDLGQFSDIATQAPEVIRMLQEQAIADAGGRLPIYQTGREMGAWYQPLTLREV
ncbi:MAG: sulfatase [Dehalococcoidia bacterium]|nr:sulfatase [Dehalococcoidia bacterium]